MKKMITLEGTIVGQPRRCGTFSEFDLKSGSQNHHVIRIDKQWQIKDLLFLCHGQHIWVTGIEEDTEMVAERITITDCSVRNYYEEKEHGNSCITRTDPGDPTI